MNKIEDFNQLVERAMAIPGRMHMRPAIAKELLHYDITLIMTETLDEIMADKLLSLVSCQRYIRYRDIWDLRWVKQQGAQINAEYIHAKINDYHELHYAEKLNTMVERIDEIIRRKTFKDEISRFIPADVLERTLEKEKFNDFLINETKSLLLQVKNILE
jgi:hypothetical protein